MLYSEFGENFCKTILNLTANKPQLKVVFDQSGTPAYAWVLTTAIVATLKKTVEGIYHYSNEGVVGSTLQRWLQNTQDRLSATFNIALP